MILQLLGPQDDDSHIEFIMTAANLRAENYGIPPVDKLQVRKKGGIYSVIFSTVNHFK